ncbi:hypothetical protein [Cryptosporangium japonicum]|uniref:hypothetical protein n=1 Tax=Cryptosporangium japonicum TaxID=80872 RepID=UPI0031CF47A0
MAVVLIAAGCGSRPEAPDPTPTGGTPIRTMARTEVGARLVLTAGVERVLGPTAFVVSDADLPDRGLLILSPSVPEEVRPSAVVHVEGVVAIVRVGEFTRFPLGDPARVRPYDGKKALIANQITLW